jgi:uncharacterized protein YoxC
MAADNAQQGVVQLVLANIPPVVKVLVFTVLSVPLVIAISGILLQVNVGATLEKVLDAQFAKMTVEQIEAQSAAIERTMAPIVGRINQLEGDIALIEDQTKALEVRVGIVEGLSLKNQDSNQLQDEQLNIGQLVSEAQRVWACAHSDTQGLTDDKPNFCK